MSSRNFLDVFKEVSPMLLDGTKMTVELTIVSLLIALVLGMLSCLCSISKVKPLNWLSKFYLWLIRGTPLLVQAFFVYFAIPQFIQSLGATDFRLTAFTAGVITICLNAGAYMSEIFRAGIQAVDKGQMEAARSLGMPKSRAMMKVVLPQAMRICVPSLVNQFIISLKDTSIISVIGFGEIVYQARIYVGNTMEAFKTWTIVALYYLVVITVLTWISKLVERKMSNGKGQR